MFWSENLLDKENLNNTIMRLPQNKLIILLNDLLPSILINGIHSIQNPGMLRGNFGSYKSKCHTLNIFVDF